MRKKHTGTRGIDHEAYSVDGGLREGGNSDVCLLPVNQPNPIDGQDLLYQDGVAGTITEPQGFP